ncbi:MAG: hypothetical protein KDE58_12645, partial [Caldilineaceae bacterium]|nr:hypothetical protein [Caldilineaceae bacterium]
HAHFHFMAGNGRNPAYAWRFDPQRASGVLGDYGSHMIDLARYLIGDIGRVHARLTTHAPHNGPDGRPLYGACDAATLLLEFRYGGQGTIELSAVARTHDPALEHTVVLHGEGGSLTANFGLFTAAPRVQLAGGDGGFQALTIPDEYLLGLDAAQPVGPQMGLLFSQTGMGSRSFVDAIVNGQTVAPSFYDGWQTQRVLDAALAAHERGRWTEV